ncbi:cell envelope integrity EipB family protein [Enterovirga rhinocerotis]|nr:cell envelope integrity EipB family protein [Enterovirga rhinocerotis]
MPIRSLALAAALILSVGPAISQDAGSSSASRIVLAPHRAVYDLSLVSSRGMRSVESARGRIALEFTGDACEGYSMKFRQVTVLESAESGSRMSDLRMATHESGDGRSYRFRNDSVVQGRTTSVDGTAERRAGAPLSVQLRTPRRQSVSLDGDAIFPNAQMKDVIAAAREGKPMLQMKLFDGSDDGRKVYETLAVIGREIKAGEGGEVEKPARQDGVSTRSRWPVTLSYFPLGRADQTPSYVLGFDVYDNGVSRALRLDYGDSSLRGDLVQLDMLPDRSGCQR